MNHSLFEIQKILLTFGYEASNSQKILIIHGTNIFLAKEHLCYKELNIIGPKGSQSSIHVFIYI